MTAFNVLFLGVAFFIGSCVGFMAASLLAFNKKMEEEEQEDMQEENH